MVSISGLIFGKCSATLTTLSLRTLPLGAIVTPAALSVEPVQLILSTPLQVPQALYDFTNYGTADMHGDTLSESARLTKLLAYTASSRSPVPLVSVFQNQTYHLAFNGPALKCGSANDSVIRTSSFEYGQSYPSFASWVPQSGPSDRTPFTTNSIRMNRADGARLMVATNFGRGESLMDTETGDNLNVIRVNVTECVLYNATYDVDFRFQYPNQTLSLRITEWLNPVIGANIKIIDVKPFTNPPDMNSYLAMMSAFGTLLVGTSHMNQYNQVFNNGTNWAIVTVDWSEAETVQRGLESLFQNFTLSLLSDIGLM